MYPISGGQGGAVIRRSTPRERGQMCTRMTCRPDELPAVNQEAPFSSTSFFQIGPTPVPTSQLHAGDHPRRRESSGGNYQHISAINCCDAIIKTEETVKRTKHTHFLCQQFYLLLHIIPQSPTSHPRAGQKLRTAPQDSQDCHLGS